MLKKILLTAATSVCLIHGYAQTAVVKKKQNDFYAGVQANQLFRQVLNLSNNNTPITNPYLFVFSMNCIENGWGLQTGIGYNYQKIQDKNSPANHVSSINDLFYRIGGGRKVMLGKRLQAGYGMDFVGKYLVDKTFTVTVTDFGSGVDSSLADAETKTTGIGIGMQGSLGFFITDKLIVSTEATYYFQRSKQKQYVNVTDYNSFNNTVTTSNSNTENEISDFTFTVPVALFLVLKF